MCEMRFDTKKKIVYFREQLGEDKGVYFASGLNLIRVKNSGDSNNFYTRIIPIGKDGLKITEANDGVEYVENYQYSNKIRTLIWEDSNYEDADTLLTDAEAKLEDLSVPKESYQADVIDLAKLRPEYKLLDYGLGDNAIHRLRRKTPVSCLIPHGAGTSGRPNWMRQQMHWKISRMQMAP